MRLAPPSRSFRGAEVFEWVSRPQTEFDNVWITDVRNWVKRTLRPRVRGQNKKKR